MDRKAHGGLLPRSRQELPKPRRRQRPAPFTREDIRAAGRAFPLQFPERPQFRTSKRMHARRPPLHAVHMESSLLKIYLVPAQRHQFRHPQAMPVCEEDQGRVPMAVPPPRLGRAHEFFHLALGEVFPAPAVAVRHALRGAGGSNCPIYNGWRLIGGCWIHAGFSTGQWGLLSR